MSLLDSNSKAVLVESMRHALVKSVKGNSTLTESVQMESVKFIKEDATYEQLLNLTLNPLRESKYLPAHTLEGAAAIISEAMLTGRRVIGVNAITEGALNLVKKTDCVVTESMLDAADQIAQSKSINVIAESLLTSSKLLEEAAKKEVVKKSAKAGKEKGKGVLKAIGDSIKKAANSVPGMKDIKKGANTLAKGKANKNVPTAMGQFAQKAGIKDPKSVAKGKKLVEKGTKQILKGGGKLAATGAAAATAIGATAYGIKKWHDKKKNAK